jgi:putative endonuclease
MLKKKGYRIIGKNVRLAGGELDLIADDQGTLVFIEVKARRGDQFGGAPYAISTRKKQQIIKLALCYLSKHGVTNTQCRFDVVLVVGTPEHSPVVTHIEHAFEVSSSDWQW